MPIIIHSVEFQYESLMDLVHFIHKYIYIYIYICLSVCVCVCVWMLKDGEKKSTESMPVFVHQAI
jgi:hypothetical protein